ncbi:MAG: phosphohydrolase, partial [Nanoarchaeota archaeon]|nr:phosphohydrolase [Nanoarchaeota archaeon]
AGHIGAVVHKNDKKIIESPEYSEDDCAYREFLIKQGVINRVTTNVGKKIANGRWKFMEDFFNRINMEVEGII